MSRLSRPDKILEALNEERDHVEIQISLLDDAETPDPPRLKALRQKLISLQQRIATHRISDD